MGPRRRLEYAATRCLTFVPCVLARYALVLAHLDHVVLALAVLALVVLVVLVLVVRAVACAALAQHVPVLALCIPVLALAASLPLANQFGTVEARELVLVGRRGWARLLVGC